jgi:hypothetical protein
MKLTGTGGKTWIGFLWLSAGTRYGFSQTRQWTPFFRSRRVTPRAFQWLSASHVWLCSVECVTSILREAEIEVYQFSKSVSSYENWHMPKYKSYQDVNGSFETVFDTANVLRHATEQFPNLCSVDNCKVDLWLSVCGKWTEGYWATQNIKWNICISICIFS